MNIVVKDAGAETGFLCFSRDLRSVLHCDSVSSSKTLEDSRISSESRSNISSIASSNFVIFLGRLLLFSPAVRTSGNCS